MDLPEELKQLFGGAMEAVIPTRWRDMSDYVPIPDNQEVFNDSQLDATAVIEILERIEQPDDSSIAYLFLDLARNNDADADTFHRTEAVREVTNSETPGLKVTWPKYLLLGEQWIRPDMSPASPRDRVKLILFLIRIPEAFTDLLVSINLPMKSQTDAELAEAYRQMEIAMQRLMATLKVTDMQLFNS